ncbi:MCA1 [[Candida] subhashii]|uniref:MCA1 n=1 Tax=[Candida] subhashii TaxID=561895 RepID=A0A8J5UR31_9ASCO|nr:MCA1 [[Candida] subhashii]KAG7665161.1 MCA1 [[Candida] subhashii]
MFPGNYNNRPPPQQGGGYSYNYNYNYNYGPPPGTPPGYPPYNNYAPPPGTPPGYPPYNNYAPPPGPPPPQGGYYSRPPGPPPSGDYSRPPGPPPSGGYSSPPGPPPSGDYARPPGPPPTASYQSNYSRPPGPPPGTPQRTTLYEPSQNDYHNLPSGPQSFGQNTNFSFQYSRCNGRKKALLIGINYFGTKQELKGCINDVKNMSQFLVSRWGYKWDDIVILTDDQREMARVPTKANIIRAMQWLVKDARPNDSLVFHYSGHGGVTEDLDGDEESGYDDVIYPLDFEQNGHIVDDDMHAIMVMPLPAGCRLTALYDSCHSGTALDLPYVYSTKGLIKEPNMLKDAGSGTLNAFMQYQRGNIGGAISSISSVIKRATKSGSVDRNRVIQMKASPADVISISGCKDDQTSADSKEGGQSTGAMSWSFIKVLNDYPHQTYLSLLNNMRTLLSEKYSQKPQLSCSHPQDMNIEFIM